MPTFSRSFEQSLQRAVALANERHHEYATLEHLLLALIDDVDALAAMKACDVDVGVLKEKLASYIDNELETLDDGPDSKPTAGFQRVIQWATMRVVSSGREEVTGADVLVAILTERDSQAAALLQEQGMATDEEALRPFFSAVTNNRSNGRLRSPTSATTSTRRLSICSWH